MANGDRFDVADVDEGDNSTEEAIRKKIVFILELYPVILPSMLQIGLGTQTPPAMWRPILNQMVAEGTIMREEKHATAPTGHSKFYTKLSLSPPTVMQPVQAASA